MPMINGDDICGFIIDGLYYCPLCVDHKRVAKTTLGNLITSDDIGKDVMYYCDSCCEEIY